ncbi:MAG: phosphomethylpyrimidine synthase ThiC, partial [Megasphaera micronuciformis]|nr:phosphomethylpyrimidine synthase ThiC [Megasphaera micronuciformis]
MDSLVTKGAIMFFTQLQAAKQGVITNEMKIVARKEGLSEEQICSLVAAGKVVI